jgi:prepilin-type N-terminal cleavage/methylation domain-containing protein
VGRLAGAFEVTPRAASGRRWNLEAHPCAETHMKQRHNNLARGRGMSLIELLVVMVILTVGIFAVIRIFPQGFTFINHARNVTLAGRLAQGEVERWKGASENVPDGIEAERFADGSIWTDYNPNDLSNADPDPAKGLLPPNPTAQDYWDWSNVNRTRLVRGETTLIPSPTQVPYSGSDNRAYSIYNLKFAPVEFDANNGHKPPPGGQFPDQFVLIYADPMPRVNVTGLSGDDLDNALDDLNNSSYAVDYDNGTLYFNKSWTDRVFKISYNYWDGGVLHNATDVITVPSSGPWPAPLDGTVTVAQGGPPNGLSHKPDDYSEQVARKFIYVPTSQSGTDFSLWDPYQFTLLNTYNTLPFAPTIGFNPRGSNRTVRTNLGTRPLRAHIDYEVADWHVIHEDRTIPSPSAVNADGYAIRMTLPSLKATGRQYNTVNAIAGAPNSAIVTAPYSGLTTGLAGYSVVALDLTDNTLMLNSTASGDGGLLVDYGTGTVTVPAAVTKYTPFGNSLTGQDIRGHMVRFFYQAVGDWAVQVSKAWSSYQRMSEASGFQNLQYNNFAAEIVPPTGPSAGHPDAVIPNKWSAVLTFPRSNAGQSVSVSFIWADKDNVTHEVTGRQYKLPEFAALNTGYPYIVVPFANPGEYTPPAGDLQWNNPSFTFVNGASMKVRVIWRENPRRWESRDLETFLTRE